MDNVPRCRALILGRRGRHARRAAAAVGGRRALADGEVARGRRRRARLELVERRAAAQRAHAAAAALAGANVARARLPVRTRGRILATRLPRIL